MFVTSRPRHSSRRTSTPILSPSPSTSQNAAGHVGLTPEGGGGARAGLGLTGSIGTTGNAENAGSSGRRQLFYAVREGHTVGVFDNWDEAEASIKDFDFPEWKTFKTLLAAEAFIAGGSGTNSFSVTRSNKPLLNPKANRSSMPAPYKVRYGTPLANLPPKPRAPAGSAAERSQLPLHERLERHFPSSVPASSSTSLRGKSGGGRPKSLPLGGLAPSPHIRMASTGGGMDGGRVGRERDVSGGESTDFGPLKPPRPAFARSSSGSSGGGSPVRRSSPLRQEVTDDEEEDKTDTEGDTASIETDDSSTTPAIDRSRNKRLTPTITLRNLMTPPISPIEPSATGLTNKRSRIEDLDRAGTGRSLFPASPLTSREFGQGQGNKERPHSVQPTLRRIESDSSLGSVGSESSLKSRKGGASVGLWGDVAAGGMMSPKSNLGQAPLLSPPFSPERGESPADPVNVLDLDPSLAAASAPKFSRSALKRADILLPLSPNQLSPAGSPTRSPTISKSPSVISLLKGNKRATVPMGSLDGLHDRLETLSKAPNASRGQGRENVGLSSPSITRTPSGLSMTSLGSERTFSSFATARNTRDAYVSSHVIDLADTPSDIGVERLRDRVETPVSSLYLDQPEPEEAAFGPIKSIPSSDANSIQTSVATHTQSENCVKEGKGSKFGRRGSKGEKSGGIGKKIMKAFGFGSGSATPVGADASGRRFSD